MKLSMIQQFLTYKFHTLALRAMPVSEDLLTCGIEKTSVFFVVSTGRTGTKWLTEILCNVPNSLIVHEPIPAEAYAHKMILKNDSHALKYIENVKRKDIYFKIKGKNLSLYGEVNGNLRRFVPMISKVFPSATLIHMVRNGRAVVRSVMARKTFSGNHPVFGKTCPLPIIHIKNKWRDLSEFEKACFVWTEENKFMREKISNLARIEDITSSYELFTAQILKPLNVYIDEDCWRKYSRLRINQTETNIGYLTAGWTDAEERIFNKICGEEMAMFGYQ